MVRRATSTGATGRAAARLADLGRPLEPHVLDRRRHARVGAAPAAARARAPDRARHGPRVHGAHRARRHRRARPAHARVLRRRRGQRRALLRDGARSTACILRTPAEHRHALARRRAPLLRGAHRRARRDPRGRLRRGRARRLRPSRRLRRAPGAPLGRAVGTVEDARAPRDRRARAPAARRAPRRRRRRRSCTATTASTTRCSRPTTPGEIVAVLDWEMATLGDPLSDLGLFLLYWGRDAAQTRQRRRDDLDPSAGFLSRDDVVERYANAVGPRREPARLLRDARRRTSSRSSSKASTPAT